MSNTPSPTQPSSSLEIWRQPITGYSDGTTRAHQEVENLAMRGCLSELPNEHLTFDFLSIVNNNGWSVAHEIVHDTFGRPKEIPPVCLTPKVLALMDNKGTSVGSLFLHTCSAFSDYLCQKLGASNPNSPEFFLRLSERLVEMQRTPKPAALVRPAQA